MKNELKILNKRMKDGEITLYNYPDIIYSMYECNQIINDCNGNNEKLIGLVEFNNPIKGLGCILDMKQYYINMCYLNRMDNKLHRSKVVLNKVAFNANIHKPIGEQIKEFNKAQFFESNKICYYRGADMSVIFF